MEIVGAAMNILKRAVELDNKKRYTEALVCYQEGLQILLDKMKGNRDAFVRSYLKEKIDTYMNRAEEIKTMVMQLKDNGQFHEQIHIENNSNGHSYKTLIGRFLDENVQFVIVEDPYIRSIHQCHNFIRLSELVVKSCSNLKNIMLITSKDDKSESTQHECFNDLAEDMLQSEITLTVKFSETLHDRQIILSTGWIIKIGRGLDFYKPPEKRYCLGLHDFDLRPCHKTTVDIVHSKNVKQSYG